MSTENDSRPKDGQTSKGSAITGIMAAVAASSCCIPPVIAVIAGVGGISSSLSWMEPLRPYLIGLAVVAIGYAWYAYLKPKTVSSPAGVKADDCGCEVDAKPRWYQTKSYLIGITLFAAISITFPYYSGIFFSGSKAANKTIIVKESDVVEAGLTIEGMTCNGCEHHVNQTLNNTAGVLEASSSYKSGKATVKFDKTKVTIGQLAEAVEKKTGYRVTEKKLNP